MMRMRVLAEAGGGGEGDAIVQAPTIRTTCHSCLMRRGQDARVSPANGSLCMHLRTSFVIGSGMASRQERKKKKGGHKTLFPTAVISDLASLAARLDGCRLYCVSAFSLLSASQLACLLACFPIFDQTKMDTPINHKQFPDSGLFYMDRLRLALSFIHEP